MKQSSYSIGLEQKNLKAFVGDHYVNEPIKVTKTSVASKLVNGVLPCGTILAKDGALGDDTTSYGVLFADLDFNNSTGTEVAPVLIHGFVYLDKVIEYSGTTPTVAQKTLLSLIKFI